MKLFFLCNMGTSNSSAMCCSQPKEFRTGLRMVRSFLKVELQHFLGGTQGLLPRCGARGLRAFFFITKVKSTSHSLAGSFCKN